MLPMHTNKTPVLTLIESSENTADADYFFSEAQNFTKRPTPLAMISSLVA